MPEPPPGPPPNLRGFNAYDVDPNNPAEATKARQIGANLIRIGGPSWCEFESAPGAYDYTKLDPIRRTIVNARQATGNPNLKALPILGGPVPTWLPSDQVKDPGDSRWPCHRSDGLPYFSVKYGNDGSDNAFAHFGMAMMQALTYFSGLIPPSQGGTTDHVADLIELYNEPNGGGGGTVPVPSIHPTTYGTMAAYAAYWIWKCLTTGSPPPNASAHPVVGAVAMGPGLQNPYDYNTYLTRARDQISSTLAGLDSSNYPAINASYRMSFHPYPNLGTGGDTSAEAAFTTTKAKIDAVMNITSSARQHLVISEAGFNSLIPQQTQDAGEYEQKVYLIDVSNYAGSIDRIQGLTWFLLSDRDVTNRPIFSTMGVTDTSLNNKKAANWTATYWP